MKIRDEELKRLNNSLEDKYGIDTLTGRPMWRISYADEQFEMRHGTWTDFTTEGFFIRQVIETREVPKYNFGPDKYVLENLVIVPVVNINELVNDRYSYETLYVFEDKNLNPLPPRYDAACFVIDLVNAAKGKGNMAKYKENPLAARERVDKIQEELFGNESDVSDALTYGEGVVVPSNYETEH